jgi:DNA (cytosine-5)-methyltransferase 1
MPRFAGLFSGCGGLDQGFIQAGYKGQLSLDIDAAALSVHQANLACPVLKADLSLDELPCLASRKVDVLLSGSPCQGFSTAGKRAINDPRNNLLYVTSRVAAANLPKVVVAENVPAVKTGAHRVYWDELHGRLRQSGYDTHDLLLDCSEHGVAQKRKRLFLIAWRTGKIINFEMPKEAAIPLVDVLDVTSDIANHEPLFLDGSSNDFKIASRIAQGQKLTNSRAGETAIHTWDIPEVFGAVTVKERKVLEEILKLRRQIRRRDFGDADPVSSHLLRQKFGEVVLTRLVDKGYLRKVGHYHDLADTYNGKYRRLPENAPSRTVDTRFGDPKLFLHPSQSRGFTVREAARIQGFDDSFIFAGARSAQYRMIGNAVPPPVAKKIGQLVKQLL